jgi:hypothetical protein
MALEPDGTLCDWSEIATAYKWDTLLLGNGLSINVWEPFGYGKLFDHACGGAILTAEDRNLFSGTPNFERVLGSLLTAIRVNEALPQHPAGPGSRGPRSAREAEASAAGGPADDPPGDGSVRVDLHHLL